MLLSAASLASIYSADPARMEIAIAAWERDLRAALGARSHDVRPWDETAGLVWSWVMAPSSRTALQVLACHAWCPGHDWPDHVPERLQDDPAYRQASESDFGRFGYPQVVLPSLWLPGDFDWTILHALPDGEPIVIGSLHALQRQLRLLNAATLHVGTEGVALDLDEGRGHGVGDSERDDPTGVVPDVAEPAAPFLAHAAAGLSVFLGGVEAAAAVPVPLIVASR